MSLGGSWSTLVLTQMWRKCAYLTQKGPGQMLATYSVRHSANHHARVFCLSVPCDTGDLRVPVLLQLDF